MGAQERSSVALIWDLMGESPSASCGRAPHVLPPDCTSPHFVYLATTSQNRENILTFPSVATFQDDENGAQALVIAFCTANILPRPPLVYLTSAARGERNISRYLSIISIRLHENHNKCLSVHSSTVYQRNSASRSMSISSFSNTPSSSDKSYPAPAI